MISDDRPDLGDWGSWVQIPPPRPEKSDTSFTFSSGNLPRKSKWEGHGKIVSLSGDRLLCPTANKRS
jgi:hypothetical protein